MTEYETNRLKIIEIVTNYKRGYSQIFRYKYPAPAMKPIGYALDSISAVEVVKRFSVFQDVEYSVSNCGKLTYKKEH